MAFTNASVDILLGNVDSRLVGPVPRQALDRALNRHARSWSEEREGEVVVQRPTVFAPTRETFLTGALPEVKRTLRRAGIRFRVRDCRHRAVRSETWQLRPGIELRPFQEEVVAGAVAAGHGKVDVGTAGGKTLLAAAIITRLGLPALYLVTTRTLLDQSVAALADLLQVTPGVIGAGVARPAPLTVALVQALESERVVLDAWRGGVLVFDEGHHAAAASYLELVRRVCPRYHFYLSAVPYRCGGDQAVLDALAGRSLTGGRYSAQYLIDKGYACPVRVRLELVALRADMAEKSFATIYRELVVDNLQRNGLIAGIAAEEAARGRSVLVLVDHVRHGQHLVAALEGIAGLIHGAVTATELRYEIRRFTAGERRCLIATAGLFQEGVSIDGINVLIQGGGLKSRVKVLQSVGRGMRRSPGKDACLYVDFWDDDEGGVLQAHSRQRLQVLLEEGFPVPPPPAVARADPSTRPVAPSWAHVPGSRRFVLISPRGTVHARGECLRKELVPAGLCRRCPNDEVCEKGGKVTWREDQA